MVRGSGLGWGWESEPESAPERALEQGWVWR